MGKVITFNINTNVRFKLTKHGKEVLKLYFKNLKLECTERPDEDGYYRMPIWAVMDYFGQDTYMGAQQIILKNRFELEVD